MCFDSSEVTAWVGAAQIGLGVGFDPPTFSLRGRQQAPAFRAAVGCAIAWYVDLCVNSGRASGDWMTLMPEPGAHSYRWMAAQSFSIASISPDESKKQSAARCGALGSCSQADADEFVAIFFHAAEAPPHLQKLMGPNDTWVRGHARGRENWRDLMVDSKGRCSLAAAIGWAIAGE